MSNISQNETNNLLPSEDHRKLGYKQNETSTSGTTKSHKLIEILDVYSVINDLLAEEANDPLREYKQAARYQLKNVFDNYEKKLILRYYKSSFKSKNML